MIAERRAAIRDVRDEIGKRYSVWRQPVVLALAVQRLGVAPGGREDTLVHDKARTVKEAEEQTRELLTAIKFALVVSAAVATAGGSLVVSAGLTAMVADLARFVDDLGRYQTDVASTRTALDPEQALSSTEPSAAPLVGDVIALAADAVALGAVARTGRRRNCHRLAACESPIAPGTGKPRRRARCNRRRTDRGLRHGTTARTAAELVESQGGSLSSGSGNFGGRFFTVPSAEVADVFAARAATRVVGQQPAVVGVALPESVAARLRSPSQGLLRLRPIENPPAGVSPGTQEWVFQPGALQTLQNEGFFFHVE